MIILLTLGGLAASGLLLIGCAAHYIIDPPFELGDE